MAEALSLREVTDLVFYDVPASKVARFDCNGPAKNQAAIAP